MVDEIGFVLSNRLVSQFLPCTSSAAVLCRVVGTPPHARTRCGDRGHLFPRWQLLLQGVLREPTAFAIGLRQPPGKTCAKQVARSQAEVMDNAFQRSRMSYK
jgi:hypothetical protein